MSNEFGIGGVQAGLRRMAALLPQLCGAFAAGLVAGAIEVGDNSTGAVVLGAISSPAGTAPARRDGAGSLPMAGLLGYGFWRRWVRRFPIAALWSHLGESSLFLPLALAAVAAWAAQIIASRIFSPSTRIRIGVIGSPQSALRLREELDREQSRGFEVAATIVPDDWDFDPSALTLPISARSRTSVMRSTTETSRPSS